MLYTNANMSLFFVLSPIFARKMTKKRSQPPFPAGSVGSKLRFRDDETSSFDDFALVFLQLFLQRIDAVVDSLLK